jgi:dihydroorotase
VFEHITTREAAQYVAAPMTAPRHDHRAPPALQPQRAVPRRPAAALLLPAGAQARGAPPRRWWRQWPSGSPKFFLGTDSAPHAAVLKEQSVCGAGCFTAPAALELYAEAFEAAGALHTAGGFRQLPWCRLLRPAAQHRHGHAAARALDAARDAALRRRAELKPLRAGDTLNWKLT